MKNTLETRNDVAHEGTLPFNEDIDEYIILVDAPRTMLIAFVAKLARYSGPILGYHDRSNPCSPPWWVETETPAVAHRQHLFTSRTEPSAR
jgi:hypothetical protein